MSPRHRGTSLIEALIALLVMGLGLLATLGLQVHLRGAADDSRQRMVAVHLAQASLDQAQSDWAQGGPSALRNLSHSIPQDGAEFLVERNVTALGTTAWQVSARVSWEGRQHDERVHLQTVIAAGDARLWLAMAEGPADGDTVLAHAVGHPGIPPDAERLGPTRRLLRPDPEAALAWLLDAQSGEVTHTCHLGEATALARIRAGDMSLCEPHLLPSVLISGHVQAALAGGSPTPGDPVPALGVRLHLSSSPHLSPPVCAVRARGSVTDYHCAVLLRSPSAADPSPYWSGRTDLVGLPLGTGGFRTCRYSRDRNGNGGIDNDEHPAHYERVQQSLRHQNFLVLPYEQVCPTPADPLSEESWSHATQAHQP